MFIKIYFGDKPLFLCDALNEEINRIAHHDDAVFIDEFSAAAVNAMLHEMRGEKVHAGIFCHSSLDDLKKAIWKKFTLVRAGGGLVENDKGEGLFIFRRNKWDLPKGKQDPGEKIEDCALREVREETGISKVRILKYLLTTYHTYDESGKHMLKETTWFLMKAPSGQKLQAQASEQISDLQWISENGIGPVLKSTYPAIADVLRAGLFMRS